MVSFLWKALVLIGVSVLLLFIWAQRRYKHWKNKRVVGPEPSFPFGNLNDLIIMKKHIGIILGELYKTYQQLPFFGTFMMFKPALVVNDPELIKQIMVKDFAYFPDHVFEFDHKYEPLQNNLFNTTGDRWRLMRAKLTPTFTTTKMKFMFDAMNTCRKDLKQYLEDSTKKSSELDIRQLLSQFGMNVIGTCAFGVECNAFEDQNSKFIKAGKTVFGANKFEGWLQQIGFFCLPQLLQNVKFSFIGNDINEFFHNLVKDTIKHRRENNIKKNDFLQLMIQLQEDEVNEAKLTTMDMAAQVFVFFIAGHETSASTATYALYELAMNPDVQDVLREDINTVLEKHHGLITYDSIAEMTYLTQVIEETLRKYPPLPLLFRKCAKDYKIPDTDVVIENGTTVMIPIHGIHRDPQYFPDPERFDPERFSPENKATMNKYIYMPFGEGPRICIGARFGMMQTRLGLISIISQYKVSLCNKTPIPLEYDPVNLILTSTKEIKLNLTKI